jgi:hypothetical protein
VLHATQGVCPSTNMYVKVWTGFSVQRRGNSHAHIVLCLSDSISTLASSTSPWTTSCLSLMHAWQLTKWRAKVVTIFIASMPISRPGIFVGWVCSCILQRIRNYQSTNPVVSVSTSLSCPASIDEELQSSRLLCSLCFPA